MDSFYFVPSNETPSNTTSLSPNDLQQAEKSAQILAGHAIATLCYSSLKQSSEIARLIASKCPCSLYPTNCLQEGKDNEEFKNQVLQFLKEAELFPAPVLLIAHKNVLEVICHSINIEVPLMENLKVLYIFKQLDKWILECL